MTTKLTELQYLLLRNLTTPEEKPRLRVRRVPEITCEEMEEVIARAHTSGAAYLAAHGGGVANCYAYPAETEVAAIVARKNSEGRIEIWCGAGRAPANKVTACGALCAALNIPHRGPWWAYASERKGRPAPETLPKPCELSPDLTL